MSLDIYNQDCFEVMKQIPAESIPLICTDPPYGIGFTGKTSDTSWDDVDDKEYREFLVRLFTEFKRILTNDGTIWFFCGPTRIPLIFNVLEEVGLHNNLENWMIYARAKGRGSSKKLKSVREDILHITKSKKYTWNSVEYLRKVVVPYVADGKPRGWALDENTGDRVRWSGCGNVNFFTSPFFKAIVDKQIHSCQKPLLLFCKLILLSSKTCDVVFDPFCGSGVCGLAANICERDFIGCELDKVMYDKSMEWLKVRMDENSREYKELSEYVVGRFSTSEKDSKLHFSRRKILPK